MNDSRKQQFSSLEQTIELKSGAEIEIMRIAGRAAASILKALGEELKPGVSTKDLDDLAYKRITELGMKPAFLGYRGYPASICISINEELVHGIPNAKRIVRNGDIVSIDMGVVYQGYYGDTAATFGVGKISSEAEKLLETTKQSLYKAIEMVKPGNRLGDVSHAVQKFAESKGYSIVRDYVGHGIGRHLHEDPPVPNFGKPGTGPRLMPGMVIAIEPMVNVGDWRVKTLADDWTVVTVDGKLCAHFEHMVAVTNIGNEILTEIL